MNENTYDGRCHCGAIGFTYRTRVPPANWSVRACQCSFCRAHDALSTSDPEGTLSFVAEQPESLQRYRFGLKTADFLLCRRCGVYIGAVIDSASGRFGIINTHTVVDGTDGFADAAPADYDSEDVDARVGRREERWTPVDASSC